jgi:hypothetical protein
LPRLEDHPAHLGCPSTISVSHPKSRRLIAKIPYSGTGIDGYAGIGSPNKEQGMRIRVPRRIVLLGIVLALLCAIPAVTPSSSVAKPLNYDPTPIGGGTGGPVSGDGDGGMVKARYIGGTTYDSASKTTVSVTSLQTWSIWRTYLLLVRQGIGIRWIGF